MDKEERLSIIAKILEAVGGNRDYILFRKSGFNSSEDVFFELVNVLQAGIFVRKRLDMSEILPSPKDLKDRLEWKRDKEKEGEEWIEEVGGAKRSFVDTLNDMIAIKGKRLPKIGMIARGIIDILDLMDEHEDLQKLYPDYVEEYGNRQLAMEKLKERIEEIHGMGRKKTLIFLRNYNSRASADMPIEKLPLPWYERHVKEVMKRAGFVEDKEDEKGIKKMGKKYFDVPLIGDNGLWYIGRRYCKKEEPNCRDCPLSEIKGKELCFKNF